MTLKKLMPLWVFLSFCLFLVASSKAFEWATLYYDEEYSRYSEHKLDTSNQEQAEILNILNKLVYINSLEDRNYTLDLVSIFEQGEVLAHLARGRKIVIGKEYLSFIQSEQGKAFLLAHEIAHGELKHLNSLSGLIFTSKTDKFEEIEDGNSFFIAKYAQNKEKEADRLAISLLKNLYGTEQLILDDVVEIFLLMNKLEDQFGKFPNKTLTTREQLQKKFADNASHPPDKVRIALISSHIDGE